MESSYAHMYSDVMNWVTRDDLPTPGAPTSVTLYWGKGGTGVGHLLPNGVGHLLSAGVRVGVAGLLLTGVATTLPKGVGFLLVAGGVEGFEPLLERLNWILEKEY